MRAPVICSVVLLATLSADALAQTTTPPPAPFLTIGGDTKQLLLDWEPVPGAAMYRIMSNTAARGYFEPITDRLPTTRTHYTLPIAAHKQPWSTQRYLVMACNPAGCTRSNEVTPSSETMLATIGYIKASNTGAHDGFGRQVALSADGITLAVAADGEDGVNDTTPESGAVYIYHRTGRKWAQEAILRPSAGLPNTRLGGGSPLAFRYMGISANGSLLAVGAPTRTMAGLTNAGVVLVFQRAADGSWTEQAQLTSSQMAANDQFGYSVDVSSDGTYIKVSSLYPQGGPGTPAGRTHIWHWNGSAWSHSGPIAPAYATDRCPTTRMSADSKMLVSACLTTAGQGRLVISQRSGANTWLRVADQPYLWRDNPNMAVDYDASWLAVHQSNEFYPGSLSIYRRDGLAWVERTNWIGGGGTSPMGYNGFGHSVEFSRDGEYLVIGDPHWNTLGAGALESWGGSTPEGGHGAVLVLKRRPNAIPQHWYTHLLKATNPGVDRFGESVAFGSSDGFYLVVGATDEDSAATGIDGDQSSEAAEDAGAVYLY